MRNLIFKVYGSACVFSRSPGFGVKLWKVDSKAYERHWRALDGWILMIVWTASITVTLNWTWIAVSGKEASTDGGGVVRKIPGIRKMENRNGLASKFKFLKVYGFWKWKNAVFGVSLILPLTSMVLRMMVLILSSSSSDYACMRLCNFVTEERVGLLEGQQDRSQFGSFEDRLRAIWGDSCAWKPLKIWIKFA